MSLCYLFLSVSCAAVLLPTDSFAPAFAAFPLLLLLLLCAFAIALALVLLSLFCSARILALSNAAAL